MREKPGSLLRRLSGFSLVLPKRPLKYGTRIPARVFASNRAIFRSVGSFEAKTHLAPLLDRVAKGESFTITKHGSPIARLVPLEENSKPDVKQVIDEILDFRKAHPLNGEDLEEWINEGRRL